MANWLIEMSSIPLKASWTGILLVKFWVFELDDPLNAFNTFDPVTLVMSLIKDSTCYISSSIPLLLVCVYYPQLAGDQLEELNVSLPLA
jgi:hypothetical protein